MSLQPIALLKSGDSLAKIASETLGDPSKWRDLADFNQLDIFQQLPIGQDLKIPSADDLQQLALNQAEKLLGQELGEYGDLVKSVLKGGDVRALAKGQLQKLLKDKAGGLLNQQIKRIDWLYG